MGSWVVAVALAVAVLSGGAPDGAVPSRGATGPTRRAEAVAPVRLDCTRPPKRSVTGAPVVPTGAMAARLCGGLVDNAGFNLTWPADTLRGPAVVRLVARLNRLGPYVQPQTCTLPLTPGFDLVLAYPDGSRVWLRGDTSGTCANVAVRGGRTWSGAADVLRAVLGLVEGQRAADGPAPSTGGPRCPSRWNDVSYTEGAGPVRPGAPVRVIACRYRLSPESGTFTQSWRGRLTRHVPVARPRSLVRLAAAGGLGDPCGGVDYDLDRTQDVLLVQDRYGDVHVVSTTSCWPSDLTGRRRYPTPVLTRTVAGLLS